MFERWTVGTCWYPSMKGKSGKSPTERQDRVSPAGRAHFTPTCVHNIYLEHFGLELEAGVLRSE